MEIVNVGRVLLIVGLLTTALGLALVLGGRLPFLGRLPGDITIRWGAGALFFPIVTCLILSVLLSIGLNLLLRFLNRA